MSSSISSFVPGLPTLLFPDQNASDKSSRLIRPSTATLPLPQGSSSQFPCSSLEIAEKQARAARSLSPFVPQRRDDIGHPTQALQNISSTASSSMLLRNGTMNISNGSHLTSYIPGLPAYTSSTRYTTPGTNVPSNANSPALSHQSLSLRPAPSNGINSITDSPFMHNMPLGSNQDAIRQSVEALNAFRNGTGVVPAGSSEDEDIKPNLKRLPHCSEPANYGILDERNTSLWDLKDGADGPHGKPPYPYLLLIRIALLSSEQGKLTLQELYDTLEQRYPYFSGESRGWKNSIRHNLSINLCFKKEGRHVLDPGKGAYWYCDLEEAHCTPRIRDRRKVQISSDGSVQTRSRNIRATGKKNTVTKRKRASAEDDEEEEGDEGDDTYLEDASSSTRSRSGKAKLSKGHPGSQPRKDVKLPMPGSAFLPPNLTVSQPFALPFGFDNSMNLQNTADISGALSFAPFGMFSALPNLSKPLPASIDTSLAGRVAKRLRATSAPSPVTPNFFAIPGASGFSTTASANAAGHPQGHFSITPSIAQADSNNDFKTDADNAVTNFGQAGRQIEYAFPPMFSSYGQQFQALNAAQERPATAAECIQTHMLHGSNAQMPKASQTDSTRISNMAAVTCTQSTERPRATVLAPDTHKADASVKLGASTAGTTAQQRQSTSSPLSVDVPPFGMPGLVHDSASLPSTAGSSVQSALETPKTARSIFNQMLRKTQQQASQPKLQRQQAQAAEELAKFEDNKADAAKSVDMAHSRDSSDKNENAEHDPSSQSLDTEPGEAERGAQTYTFPSPPLASHTPGVSPNHSDLNHVRNAASGEGGTTSAMHQYFLMQHKAQSNQGQARIMVPPPGSAVAATGARAATPSAGNIVASTGDSSIQYVGIPAGLPGNDTTNDTGPVVGGMRINLLPTAGRTLPTPQQFPPTMASGQSTKAVGSMFANRPAPISHHAGFLPPPLNVTARAGHHWSPPPSAGLSVSPTRLLHGTDYDKLFPNTPFERFFADAGPRRISRSGSVFGITNRYATHH